MVKVLVDDLKSNCISSGDWSLSLLNVHTSFAGLPISEKAMRLYQSTQAHCTTKLALDIFVPGIGAMKTLGTGILTSIVDIVKERGAVV